MTTLVKTELETEIESDDASRNIERQIGNTPLLSFRRVTKDLPANVRVLAKAEWQNPGGSVKDRAAYGIISSAEAGGQLRPGKTILDSTSGNTGIAYAMIGAAKDYRVKLFLPENVSPERVAISARLRCRPRLHRSAGRLGRRDSGGPSIGGARAGALLLCRSVRQSGQLAGALSGHGRRNLAADQGGGDSLPVAGLGTSGTLMGAGRRLKEFNSAVQIVSVEPDSPFHGLEGLKHMESAIRPAIFDANFADQALSVRTEDAHAMALRLAREEGYLVGISSAAAMIGALRVAEALAERGQCGTVVTLFPDNAYKYLSEAFWRG